jgi:GDP-4-dehydro-6-deoxy-D-mannose reductase
MRVNAAGTAGLFGALDELGSDAAVLVSGSSEVYGVPDPVHLPLRESAPLRTETAYGLSKLAQENVALDAFARGRRVVVTRSFSHIGPGQREVFVAPAIALRALAFRDGHSMAIPIGNLQVRREFTDVRDTVRAYRLLLEALIDGRTAGVEPIFNVATGRAVSISELVEIVCSIVGVEPKIIADPAQVRPNDPPEIRGDPTLLRQFTGWAPAIPFATTIADLVHSLEHGATTNGLVERSF